MSLPLVICVALLPRYAAKAWKFGFAPDDIDHMRYIRRVHPEADLTGAHAGTGGALSAMKGHAAVASDAASGRTSRAESISSIRPPSRASRRYSSNPLQNPGSSPDMRSGSRTDMSTGLRSVHRGFDFATEEGGVAIRRMQTDLSERRLSSRNLAAAGLEHRHEHRRTRLSEGMSHVFSLKKLTNRRPASRPTTAEDKKSNE